MDIKEGKMIKAITSYTKEMDYKDVATEEILSQIEAQGPLLKNSFGFINCVPEFIDSGVASAIAEALPFDVIGTTTISSIAPGVEDPEWALTLLVLTSDDVIFVPGLTEPITKEDPAPIAEAYAAAEERAFASGVTAGTKPALVIDYSSLLTVAGGDFYTEAMSEAAGGKVPIFGLLTVDNSADYSGSKVIYGSDTYKDRVAFVLMYGDVKPKFYIATLAAERLFRDKGVITDVDGNLIHTINDVSVIDYLSSLGIERDEDGSFSGVNSYPFVVDLGDGMEPIIRILFAVTPDGDAVCGGNLPKGSVISIGSINADGIIEATSQKLDDIFAGGKPNALLMFSCIGRYLVLGYEQNLELDAVKGKLAETGVPFTFAYVGGEICPVRPTSPNAADIGDGERLANRFHNETFIALAL
jgi:hypothetical protein